MRSQMDAFDRHVADLAVKCRKEGIERLGGKEQREILRGLKGIVKKLSAETGKILVLINSIRKWKSSTISGKELDEEKSKICVSFDNDPVLRAKLLEVAGSPYHNMRDVESTRTRHLIDWLGPDVIGNILSYALVVSKSSEQHEYTYGVSSDSFWLHSTGVGLCLETFYDYLKEEQRERIKNIFPGESVEQIYSYLFLIGLFHDIGKIVLSQKLFPLYKIVIEKQKKTDKNLQRFATVDAEKNFFNFTHVDLGAMLLRDSLIGMDGSGTDDRRFFGILIKAMQCHHDLDFDAGEFDLLGKLLYLANRFLITNNITGPKYGLVLARKSRIRQIEHAIGISSLFGDDTIHAICAEVERKLFEIFQAQGTDITREECRVDTELRQKDAVKKYDVFISSTLDDLKEEKQAAIDALNSCGATFRTMEFLNANPVSPLEVSLETVSKCRIYIGIIGFRYGTIPENKKMSYTELEYIKAKEENLARFIYIKSLEATVSAESFEWCPHKLKELKRFRDELEKNFQTTYASFENPDQLKFLIYKDISDYL